MKNLLTLLVSFAFLMVLSETVSAVSSDGLIWTNEPGIRVGIGEYAGWGVSSPEVVRLPDGTYRMYYTGHQTQNVYDNYRILSATSSDGINWTQELGIRINNDGINDSRYAYSPDIIELPDGTYRMYYTGLVWGGIYRILSAVSSDGLNWTKESGVRIPPPNVTSGDTIILSGGTYRYRMYYSAPGGTSGGAMIISAVSSDGLTWTKENGIRVDNGGIYDFGGAGHPDIVELPDGTYRMYYSGWDEVGYHILSAVSSDGLTWTKEAGEVITGGGIYDSQYAHSPHILELSGGAYRMYYTGYDGQYMRILSAISEEEILEVTIDIKPGSYPNSINLRSKGVIPVAILSEPDFDATSVDPNTVELAGASVVKRGKGNKFMAHKEDVNEDGLLDLVVQVVTADSDASLLEEVEEDNVIYTYAVLTASTYDGQDIEGRDEITIVPPEQ